MKLKAPYSFAQRRPILKDSVFYVPSYYKDHHNFSLSYLDMLPQGGSQIHVEYCSGNGHWIIERAKLEPHILWIAIEKRFERAGKIWTKMKSENVSNLLIVAGEGYTFTEHYLLTASIDAIYINFPDPWPKNKHIKHRLMQGQFVQQMQRILKPFGKVVFVTDDAPYLEWTKQQFLTEKQFSAPAYSQEMPGYGNSTFEKLWKSLGKKIYFVQWTKSL